MSLINDLEHLRQAFNHIMNSSAHLNKNKIFGFNNQSIYRTLPSLFMSLVASTTKVSHSFIFSLGIYTDKTIVVVDDLG